MPNRELIRAYQGIFREEQGISPPCRLPPNLPEPLSRTEPSLCGPQGIDEFSASPVLGGSAFMVGLVEGLGESTALIVKVFSGTLSDYLGKRKVLAVRSIYLTNAD